MKSSVQPLRMARLLVRYLFLLLLTFLILLPLCYAIFGSFKSNYEVTLGGTIFPKEWVFSNYPEAMRQFNFLQYFGNSVWLSVMTTALSLLICAMAGYCLTRTEFIGRKWIEKTLLVTMFLSIGTVTLRPLYLLMVSLRLHGTLFPVALIIVSASMGTNVFLISRFVETVPKSIDEAAYIDGAGTFTIFLRVIVPLIRPILGVVGLFSFRSAWNDYINSNIFTMTQTSLRPLTVGVVSLRYGVNAAAQWNIMLAGASMSIIPMLIVYVFANRTFINGLAAGAVK